MDGPAVEAGSQMLFVADAVLPFFGTDRVRGLVPTLRDRFPGSRLVCDLHTPHAVRMENLHLALIRSSARIRWG